MITAPAALSLEHIDKRFGRVDALKGASLFVRQGTVHALLGENGAGKTTLMRIAYGMELPDGGVVRIHGAQVHLQSPADAISHGLGMVHQHFTLVPAMTAAENVALGGRGLFDPTAMAARIERLTRTTGLQIDPTARVGTLSVTAQQRLELLKLLSRNASTLILDEPTAVLAPAEADELLRQLRQLADAGRAVILITHKLREALQVADDVTVLRRGTTSLSKTRSQVDDDQLIEAMLGHHGRHEPTTKLPAHGEPAGDAIIRARDITIEDGRGVVRIRNASFEVRGGEIVGVAAVEGSGHKELLHAVAGRLPPASGTLVLPSRVGFVPEDRHRDALALGMSLAENFALSRSGNRRGLIDWKDVRSTTRKILKEFDVRAENELVVANILSGGNQQKFILGRELYGPPAALVVENPTRGLDIVASTYVHGRLREACSSGVAIVIYSTDLDELLAMSHRILVVFGGTVREIAASADLVGRAMLGAA